MYTQLRIVGLARPGFRGTAAGRYHSPDSDPSEQGCECCEKASNSPTKKKSLSDAEISMLHAQIDELLASL